MNGILIYHIYGIIMGYEWDTQTVLDLDVFQWDGIYESAMVDNGYTL
jgi:hypothetical protein